MAQGRFKNNVRGQRQYTVDALFTNGMTFTNGAIDSGFVKTLVNYNIVTNGETLVPRAGLRTSELILPDILHENDMDNNFYHFSEEVQIKAAKENVEADGKTYRQFILGSPVDNKGESKLWVATVPESEYVVSDLLTRNVESNYDINLSHAKADIVGMPCAYFTVPMTKIHGMVMEENRKIASLVGTFAFNNGFYFINPKENCLYTTKFIDKIKTYGYEKIAPKTLSPSEAVSYGYNMLSGEKAYTFINRSIKGNIQLTGILPYSLKDPNSILMTPKKNEDIYFRCYFDGELNQKYKFVWEWRNIGDSEWNVITDYSKAPTYTLVESTSKSGEIVLKDTKGNLIEELQVSFKAPTENIMLRVQAFNVTSGEETNPIVEKAMVVGFDFSLESYGTTTNVKQEHYNLATATGMAYWKNRLVLWGVPKDPTILFVSDTNDASYFPYPNNISVFDEPIVAVHPFLDSLLVFTISKIYQVTLNEDGSSWNSTIIQSNLNIDPWDRHLIQVVRNMVFFKSGNYYFMIVPKPQSTTGELVLAPISNPMTEFFNHFEKNVTDIISDVFNYKDTLKLLNYYNFLDYEDVHNIYVFDFYDNKTKQTGYLHFDVLYNTVTRTWRIHTYEAPHFLYPYKHDATQNGTLASTDLISVKAYGEASNVTVAVKAPESMVSHSKVLYLSDNGYDFYNTDSLTVEVYSPVGVGTRYVLDTYKWDTTHTYEVTGNGCRLSSEILEDGVGLKLELIDDSKFMIGSKVAIYNSNNLNVPIWGPIKLAPEYGSLYSYKFNKDSIGIGTVVEFGDYSIRITHEETTLSKHKLFKSSQEQEFWIEEVSAGNYYIHFPLVYQTLGPTVTIVNSLGSGTTVPILARSIQLYKFDSLDVTDFYIPNKSEFVLNTDTPDNYFGYEVDSIYKNSLEAIGYLDKLFRFKNWQFVDTGYRNDSIEYNKRYRELQFQLNNIDGSNLEFGLEFQIDGQTRLDYYNYEVEHVTDENNPNYGLLYVSASPVMNISTKTIDTADETVLGYDKNYWTLDQSYFPEVSLWKVRAPVSGKGAAPRVRLLSHNACRFELMSIHWVYRLLYMR